MNSNLKRNALLVALLGIALAVPSFSQDQSTGTQGANSGSVQNQQDKNTTQGATQQSTTADQGSRAATVAAGQKMSVEGVIIKRSPDGFVLLDERGQNIPVTLSNSTQVKERKSNPFRRAKNYATTQLLRGLQIEVKGHGDNAGMLLADEIKIKSDDLKVASTVESRVNPVEGRLGEAETRLGQSEQNAQRLSGQVDELTAISNAARGGAKAAQETADQAQAAAGQAQNSANEAKHGVQIANERITSLDDYEVRESTTVNFKAGSAVLSKEAKANLDKIAEQAQNEKGFVIEVRGFASSDGNEAFNRRLSQRRADAVIQYLAENHTIPLRRLVTPFGYGEKQPVADNSTRDGRRQNRRVEVSILVSKGLVQSASNPQTSSNETTPQR
jgi:OmpA-OmpF porin, OOP family